MAAASGPTASQEMLSGVNSVRLAALVEKLSSHLGTAARSPDDLHKMCFALARGIDFALSNNDIPAIACCLPSLLKQVYQHKNDDSMKPALTMLMISIKNACRNGWFHVTDSAELLKMADELCSSFCMMTSIVNTEMRNALDTISNIFPRFYPQLKLCRLVVSFEAKPGYSVLMSDFHIQKYITPEENISLFVAQTDKLETSSCLVSPPQVSFLVNGKGIERRTNVFVDSGPQFPTDITKMLKYGTNIIQAFGSFNGNYIIAIAFMSKITSASPPVLPDYVPPIVRELNSDPELIEGPSRISLKCPISFTRIRTPVKGQLCNHHQCFDYDNYMEMNSRKPSWRCPCCNQPTSFIDLRIDQNMVKVLGDVRDVIADVVVFADGSWKEFVESDGSRQLHNGAFTLQQNGVTGCERNEISSPLANVLDLTMDDYGESDALLTSRQVEHSHGSSEIDNNKCETEDMKPFRSSQGFPLSQSFQEQLPVNHVTGLTQGASNQTTDYMCPRNWSTANASNGTLESLIPNNVLNPVITDANSIISTVSERPQIPTQVSRIPVAVQTLPAHIQASSSVPRMAPWAHSGFSDGLGAMSGDVNAQQHSWPSDPLSTLQQLQTRAQNLDQDRRSCLNPIFQQIGIPASFQSSTIVPSGQLRVGAYGATLQIPSDHPNHHYQLPRRIPTASQCPNTLPQLSCTSALQVQQAPHTGMAAGNLTAMMSQYDQLLTSHAAMVARLQSINPCLPRTGSSYPILTDGLGLVGSEQLQNIVVGPTVVSRAEGFPGLPSEHQWQPTGRMRGSLTGGAYSAAINRYLSQRSQQVSAGTQVSALATSSQLLGFSSNNINDQRSTVQQASWRHSS